MRRELFFALAFAGALLAFGCGSKPAAMCLGCGVGQVCASGVCVNQSMGGGTGTGTGGGSAAGGGSATGGGGAGGGFTPSPHRAFPTFPQGTGHVLSPLTLVTITASNDANGPALQSFSDELLMSSWYTAVGADYGVGPAGASVHRTGAAINASPSGAEVLQYVTEVIAAGGPQPNGQTLYLVYLPAPYKISDSTDCGYHKVFPDAGATLGDGWGVVGTCAPYVGGETQLEAFTRIGSHEIIEGVTDSFRGYRLGVTPTTPWTESVWHSYEETGNVEVADLCEGTRVLVPGSDGGLLEYQRSWSNSSAAAGLDPCAPAASTGYFNVDFPRDWYPVDAGTTAMLPMTGWSTTARGPWLMRTYLKNGSANLLAIGADAGFWTSQSALGTMRADAGCAVRAAINDGVAGDLEVDMPLGAHTGDWAVFAIHSYEDDPNLCNPYVDRDEFHLQLVGVYVP